MSQTTFNPAPIAPVITRAEFGYSKVLFTLSYAGLNDQDIFGNAVWAAPSSGGVGSLSTNTPAGGPCMVSGLVPSTSYSFTISHYDNFVADAGTALLVAHYTTVGSTLLNDTSSEGATAAPITINTHENVAAGIVGGIFGPVIHFYLQGVGNTINIEVQNVSDMVWVPAYQGTVVSPGFVEASLAPGVYNVRYSSSFLFSNGVVDVSAVTNYPGQVTVADGSAAFDNISEELRNEFVAIGDAIQADLDDLEEDLLALDALVDATTSNVSGLTSDMIDTKEALAGLNTSVGTLTTNVTNISEDLLALTNNTSIILDDVKLDLAIERLSRKETDKQLFNATAATQAFKQSIEAGLSGLSSAVVEVDPISGQIRNNAFRYTDNKFTSASLLIDGANASITLLADKVEVAETSIIAANSEIELLAGQIALRATYTEVTEVVAGAISAIQPVYSFGFFNSTEGWTAVNGSVSNTVGFLNTTWGDIQNVGLNYSAEENPVITISLERLTGTGWVGSLIITTVEAGETVYPATIPDVTIGTEFVRNLNLAGDPLFTGTVTGVRLVLGASVDDTFKITSIVIGKPSAQLEQLEGITAQVNNLGIELNAVDAKFTSYVTSAYYTDNTVTLGNVSSVLDGQEVIIGLVATKETLDSNGTITKANTAKTWIDGAESNITSIVTAFNAAPGGIDDQLDEISGDLTTASQRIDAVAGLISSEVVSINNLQLGVKDLDKLQFFAEAELLKQRDNLLDQGSSIAIAKQELTAKTSEIGALSEQVLTLIASTGTHIGQLNATVQEINTALTNETSARATSTEVLKAELSTGLLATNSRIDEVAVSVEGTATSLSSLSSKVNNQNTGLAAAFTLAGLAKTTADGAASSSSTISNKVNNPVTGLAATFILAGLAKSTADGAVTATGGLQTAVTGLYGALSNTNILLTSTIDNLKSTSESLAAVSGAISDPTTGISSTFILAGQAKSTADGAVTSITTLGNKISDPVTGLEAAFTLIGTVEKTADDAKKAAIDITATVEDPLDGLYATFGLAGDAWTKADNAGTALATLKAAVDDTATGLSATFTLAGVAKSDAKKAADATAALKAVVDNVDTGLNATFSLAGSASITAGNALSAVGILSSQVSSLSGGVSAASSLATSAKIEAGVATTAVTNLTTRVNDSVNGLTATFNLAGSAKTEAGNATSAVGGLSTSVATLTGELGTAKLLLDTTVDEVGIVKSRAFLGVSSSIDNTSIITGITLDSVTRAMEFRADVFRLADTSGGLQMYWDAIRHKWVFNGDLVAANFQTGTSGTRAEMGSKDMFPFWFGTGEKTAANAKMYVDTSGNVVLNDAFVKGKFVTDNGTGIRTEIHDDGTYLVWVGTGPKTDANGVFWIKKDNTGFIKGSFFQGQIIETKAGSASASTISNITAVASGHKSAGAAVEIGVGLSVGCSVLNAQVPNQSSRRLTATINVLRDGVLLQSYSRAAQSLFDGQVTEWWLDFQTTLIDTTTAGLHDFSTTVQYSWSTNPSGTLQGVINSLNITTFENTLV